MGSRMWWLVTVLGSAGAVVLVPSSQYTIALSPTFGDMTLEAIHELQEDMEAILMHTTERTHRVSLQPRDVNVVIQDHVQTVNKQTSFELKSTLVTFVVLGNFDKMSAATGPKFMDSLVYQAFNRAIFKDLFITLLKESPHETLKHVHDTSIEKQATEVQLDDTVITETTFSSAATGLTTVDICLIVVSSFIFVAIVLVVLFIRKEATPKEPDPRRRRRARNYPSPAVQQRLATTDASIGGESSSRSVTHLQFVPSGALSDKAVNPNFRIIKHSPPTTPSKTISTTVKGSPTETALTSTLSSAPSAREVSSCGSSSSDDSPSGDLSSALTPSKSISTTAKGSPTETALTSTLSSAPSAREVSSCGSSSSDDSCSGDLSSALGTLSEQFSSKWFEGSQNSFSVDSQDIFAVDVVGKSDDSTTLSHCSTAIIASSKEGIPIMDWSKSIRVISSDKSSVATRASAPESMYFNADAYSESDAGFVTI